MCIEPAKRVIVVALTFVQMIRLPPAARALSSFLKRSWGSRPRLYAGVRSADFQNEGLEVREDPNHPARPFPFLASVFK
jgi:hypothetical protein